MKLKRMNMARNVQPHDLPTLGRCPECGTFGPCQHSSRQGNVRHQYRKCPECGETFQTAMMITDRSLSSDSGAAGATE